MFFEHGIWPLQNLLFLVASVSNIRPDCTKMRVKDQRKIWRLHYLCNADEMISHYADKVHLCMSLLIYHMFDNFAVFTKLAVSQGVVQSSMAY